MIDITKIYKKHGALLSVDLNDATFLVSRKKGEFDSMGDTETGVGVSIFPDQVDYFKKGEIPILILKGNIIIERGEVDHIVKMNGDV